MPHFRFKKRPDLPDEVPMKMYQAPLLSLLLLSPVVASYEFAQAATTSTTTQANAALSNTTGPSNSYPINQLPLGYTTNMPWAGILSQGPASYISSAIPSDPRLRTAAYLDNGICAAVDQRGAGFKAVVHYLKATPNTITKLIPASASALVGMIASTNYDGSFERPTNTPRSMAWVVTVGTGTGLQRPDFPELTGVLAQYTFSPGSDAVKTFPFSGVPGTGEQPFVCNTPEACGKGAANGLTLVTWNLAQATQALYRTNAGLVSTRLADAPSITAKEHLDRGVWISIAPKDFLGTAGTPCIAIANIDAATNALAGLKARPATRPDGSLLTMAVTDEQQADTRCPLGACPRVGIAFSTALVQDGMPEYAGEGWNGFAPVNWPEGVDPSVARRPEVAEFYWNLSGDGGPLSSGVGFGSEGPVQFFDGVPGIDFRAYTEQTVTKMAGTFTKASVTSTTTLTKTTATTTLRSPVTGETATSKTVAATLQEAQTLNNDEKTSSPTAAQ